MKFNAQRLVERKGGTERFYLKPAYVVRDFIKEQTNKWSDESLENFKYKIRRLTARMLGGVGRAGETPALTRFPGTGRMLLEAKAILAHSEWGRLIEEREGFESFLPLGARTAQRPVGVSKQPLLSNPTHMSDAPPSWRTLYELAKLSDVEERLEGGDVAPGGCRTAIAPATMSGGLQQEMSRWWGQGRNRE